MELESVNGSDYDERVIDDTDYVQEAEHFVYNCNQISIENALLLNKQMRVYLNNLKEQLERMLNVCQEKYKQNDLLLAEMNKSKNEPKLYTTYYFCGYPFFKDRRGGASPKSAEYLRRSEKEGELFPLDLEKRCVWMPRDKVELVQGVKKQVIEFLQSKNRTKIRQTAGKRLANELAARIRSENDALDSMHLKELLKKAGDFRINWHNISMDALQDRHTYNECMAMWLGYLQPTLNRKPWTPTEEDTLLNAALKFGAQNWAEISKAMENRSVYQCFVHYQTHFSNKNLPKNNPWTTDEDQQLISCVEKYRIGNIIPWTKVLENCPGRSKVQLYNRYMFTLNPDINRTPFTVEEDCILMAAIKEYGLNYREFPTNLLPGRSMKQIRSRYNNVLKHVNVREHWTELHDRKLMALVDCHGTTDWVKIADEMVSHSRTSCRQRYSTIRKFLDKNPDKTVLDVPRRKRAFSTNVTTDNWMETIIQAKNFESIEVAQPNELRVDIVDPRTNSKREKSHAQTSTVGKPALYSTPYYDFLKYSFNFKFGETVPGSDALFENVQIACQLLQAQEIPKQINFSNPSFSGYVSMRNNAKKIQLEPELLRSLIHLGKNDFLYPVNLNTILGMRGLTIMFEANEKKKSTTKAIKEEPNTIGEHNALSLFKMRFKSIFKQTAAVARLQRTLTSVSLRLRSQNPIVRRPAETTTPTVAPTAYTNEESVETLAQAGEELDNATYNTENLTMSESEELPPPPSKRYRVTILESITSKPETINSLQLPQASTSSDVMYSGYRYRVATSSAIQAVNIQPYVSESETDGMIGDETDFVIWTPTITDEATGSATMQNELNELNE